MSTITPIAVVNKPTSDGLPAAAATDHSAEHVYRYKVQMTCGGCSGAVSRVLKKAQDSGEGVTSYTVSLESQSVEVRGPIGFDVLTTKIEKTGKKILDKEEVGEVLATPEAEPIAPQPVAVA